LPGVPDPDHWIRWHAPYADPGSSLSRRLAVVQRRLTEALDSAPSGPVRVVSLCSGQGRDVIDVVAQHPRRADVTARLVEADPRLVDDARDLAGRLGVDGLDLVGGDASTTSAFEGMAPVDVVLVCGVFGNIADVDIRATIAELPHLCAAGASVIWTRHRRPPDLTPSIRSWFAEQGFAEVAFDTEPGSMFGVGTHRFAGRPLPWRPDRRLFTFVGDGADAHH
jgi:hypothetical protein